MLTETELLALWVGAKVSFVGVLAATPLALLCSWVSSNISFWGRSVFTALLYAPLIVPPVAVGYGLLLVFSTQAPIGAALANWFGWHFIFSWTGAALAVAITTFPFQIRAMTQAFAQIDPRYLETAATLGAGPWDRFCTIVVPLALPGLVAGVVTAVAAAFGEFGAIITFVANIEGQTQTLPLAIYSALQTPGGESAAARLVIVSLMIALTGLLISEILLDRLRKKVSGGDRL